MEHESEYHEAMISLLEMLWGKDFMSPGGEGNIANLMDGLDVRNKSILDIGSGLGGPAFVLAEKYGASVVGIDIEADLVERATRRAAELGLEEQTQFHLVEPGPLSFPSESFDLVFSIGAFTQVENKLDMFEECRRVLKPGGVLTCYDWMKTEGEYSEDMLYFFKMEGLTYAMETPERHRELLEKAGFTEVEIKDRSAWYWRQAKVEYEQLSGELFPHMVELLGQKDADHFVENWRALVVVCDNAELLQVYCRGRKPL